MGPRPLSGSEATYLLAPAAREDSEIRLSDLR
jgi:hypothetical protein